MISVIVTAEVDNVEEWVRSSLRQRILEPLGITSGKSFTDTVPSNRVALYLEVPDIEAFRKFAASEETAQAQLQDGVRLETLVLLEEAADHP
jgi:hypothetical protein